MESSELFVNDILGLDDDLYKTVEKEALAVIAKGIGDDDSFWPVFIAVFQLAYESYPDQ